MYSIYNVEFDFLIFIILKLIFFVRCRYLLYLLYQKYCLYLITCGVSVFAIYISRGVDTSRGKVVVNLPLSIFSLYENVIYGQMNHIIQRMIYMIYVNIIYIHILIYIMYTHIYMIFEYLQ